MPITVRELAEQLDTTPTALIWACRRCGVPVWKPDDMLSVEQEELVTTAVLDKAVDDSIPNIEKRLLKLRMEVLCDETGQYFAFIPGLTSDHITASSLFEAVHIAFLRTVSNLTDANLNGGFEVKSDAPKPRDVEVEVTLRVKGDGESDELAAKEVFCGCGSRHANGYSCIPIHWRNQTWHPQCAFREARRILREKGLES